MDRGASLGFQINHVARQLAWALHDRIAPLGVVPGQFAQLLALYERDGITQHELCEIVGIEQPTMANTLGRMERVGLVERRPHPTDGRKQLIFLTEKARALEDRLVEAAQSVNSQATAGLSQTEKSTLMELVSRVQTNMCESSRPDEICLADPETG